MSPSKPPTSSAPKHMLSYSSTWHGSKKAAAKYRAAVHAKTYGSLTTPPATGKPLKLAKPVQLSHIAPLMPVSMRPTGRAPGPDSKGKPNDRRQRHQHRGGTPHDTQKPRTHANIRDPYQTRIRARDSAVKEPYSRMTTVKDYPRK